MHSSGFSGASYPIVLHSAFEDYVPTIQAMFPATAWDRRWIGDTPDQVAAAASAKSNASMPALYAALTPVGLQCSYNPEGNVYTGYCFVGNQTVINLAGSALTDAYNSTASYLYAFRNAFGQTSWMWTDAFTTRTGWNTQTAYPRLAGDVNHDGKADIIGFADDGVNVALSTGSGFAANTVWLNDFSAPKGWTSFDTYPRAVADVNGDGKADIIGFGNGTVWVALSTGTGFAAPTAWNSDFTPVTGWTSFNSNPRIMADVNGDGKADIVGFGASAVLVALSTGTSFAAPTVWTNAFTAGSGGWSSFDSYPRMLADVNGDGKADIIGFADDGAYVGLNTGSSFSAPQKWISNFAVNAGGWSTYTTFPRVVTDMNGDGKADIVGFGANGVLVSLSNGLSFAAPTVWINAFAQGAGGWNSFDSFPRMLADFNGDRKPDIIGFAYDGADVAINMGNGFNPYVLTY